MQGDRTFGLGAKIGVSGLAAEMRQVDQGHGVGGADTENRAGSKRQEPLARAQHGEGAEKPLAVHGFIPIGHARGVAAAGPMGKVSNLPR